MCPLGRESHACDCRGRGGLCYLGEISDALRRVFGVRQQTRPSAFLLRISKVK